MLHVGRRELKPALFFSLLLIAKTTAGLAEQPFTILAAPPQQTADRDMGQEADEAREQFKALAREHAQALQNHFRRLRIDANRLLGFAVQLKRYSASHSGSELDHDARKKIHEIEDLSHDLRKLMYNKNLPHIRTSGTNLVPRRQSTGSQEELSDIRPAITGCWEMAKYVHDEVYSFLEKVNQNTVSVSAEPQKTAHDIVRAAGRLEGLAYEMRHW